MIRVLVNGARGRMGTAACAAIDADSDLSLVGESDKGDNLADRIREVKPQVVVDLTVASAGYNNCKIILEAGVRAVMGTSGFSYDQYLELKEIAKTNKSGGLIVPNFAIGAVLMMKFAEIAAKYFDYAEVTERHGTHKEEAPSGTAVRTAEIIEKAHASRNLEIREGRGKELIEGARGAMKSNVAIHSQRMPGSVAVQEVLFGGVGQTLSIKHDSISRDSFMPGVVLAIKKGALLNELMLGLEHVL